MRRSESHGPRAKALGHSEWDCRRELEHALDCMRDVQPLSNG